jgi:hypothetical protein
MYMPLDHLRLYEEAGAGGNLLHDAALEIEETSDP